MKNIDVVLISSIRPQILEITLNTFRKNLLGQFAVRLIVNIDPIGEADYSQADILTVCQQHFDHVVYRTPDSPSFSHAVKWCWEQVESDFFFHLEDDWCLKTSVNPDTLVTHFQNESVVSVRLSLTQNKKFRIDKTGLIHSNGFSLNPSMFRTSYIKKLLKTFDTTLDPEKQFTHSNLTISNEKPTFLVYGNREDKSIVIDTGKKWRKSNSLVKWDTKAGQMIRWNQLHSDKYKLFRVAKYHFFLAYWRLRYC